MTRIIDLAKISDQKLSDLLNQVLAGEDPQFVLPTGGQGDLSMSLRQLCNLIYNVTNKQENRYNFINLTEMSLPTVTVASSGQIRKLFTLELNSLFNGYVVEAKDSTNSEQAIYPYDIYFKPKDDGEYIVYFLPRQSFFYPKLDADQKKDEWLREYGDIGNEAFVARITVVDGEILGITYTYQKEDGNSGGEVRPPEPDDEDEKI